MRAYRVAIYVLGHLGLLCEYTVAYHDYEPNCLDGWTVVYGNQCSRNAPGSGRILARDAVDLLARYKLTGNLHDSVAGGAAMTATVSGVQASFIGGALAPGVSLNIPSTIPSNSHWTLSLWVKITNTSPTKSYMFSFGTTGSYLGLYMQTVGSFPRILSESGPRQITTHLISGHIDDSQKIFRDNVASDTHGWRCVEDEWWHYAITSNNNVVTEYFNGRERSSKIIDGRYDIAPPAGILGAALASTTTNAAFMDFRIYRAALTASEISELAFWVCDAGLLGLFNSGIDTATMAKSLVLVPSVSPVQFASRGTRTLTSKITSLYQLDNMPTFVAVGGPDGGPMLLFSHEMKNQYVDAGRHTFNLKSNGGFTAVAVLRYTRIPTGDRVTIFKFHENDLSTIELSISPGATRLVFDISNGNQAPCSVSRDRLMISNSWLIIIMTYTHNDQTMRLKVQNTTGTFSSYFTCPLLRTDREVNTTMVAFPDLNSVQINSVGFLGNIAGLFAVDRVLTPMAISGIVLRMRAGEDTLNPCISCRVGTATTTLQCSGACGCSPTVASDNLHEGVIVNGPGNYQAHDVCTWIITSTASILAIVTERVGLGNVLTQNEIIPSVCGLDQSQVLSCIPHATLQTSTEFTVTPHTIVPVPGWTANATGSVQILRIQFRATHPKQDGVHFALHWKAYGDQVDCITPCPSGSGYVDRSCVSCDAGTFNLDSGYASTCTQCATGTYKTQPGPGLCKRCPAGQSTNVTGAVSQNSCMICAAGTHQHISGGACEPCATGTYKTQPGPGTCTKCLLAYSTVTGAVSADSCIPCAAGTHPRSDGAGCEPCPSSYSARVLSNVLHGIGPMPGCIEFVGA